MTDPITLTEQAYLLCYDLDKNRLTVRDRRGLLVRAAALTELYLAGALTDDRDRAAAARGARSSDPLLAGVLDEVTAKPGKRWRYWVRQRPRVLEHAVRDRLAARHVLVVREGRFLGIIPHAKVEVRDPRAVKAAGAAVAAALRDPAARLNPHGAALLALLAAGDVRTVLSRAQRRQHRDRVTQCTELAGPAAVALRRAVSAQRSATAGAAAGAAASGS